MIATYYMHVPQWGPLTLIELLWLLSGVLALLFCGSHFRELWRDRVAARGSERRPLVIAARANLRREVVRFLIGCDIAGFGIYAAVLPNPRPGAAYISIVGLILTVLLLAIAFSTALMSYWDWHDRGEILHQIELEKRHSVEEVTS
jgi:hypothetical protein